MVGVGLIGVGFMGGMHFRQYEQLNDRARIAAICDTELDRRAGDWSKVGGNIGDPQANKRDLKGIAQYEDYKQLIADPNVQLVDVCVPTYLHSEIASAALKSGKHVLSEKPMALTVEECDEMLALAAKSPGMFMIGQCVRFWPECAWLKKAIGDKRYGALKALHLRRQAATPDYSLHDWLLDPKLSGGAILDLHVHDTDFALYLLGKPKTVTAQAYQRVPDSYDRVHTLWHYGPELVVQIEGAWDLPSAFGFNMGYTAVFEEAAAIMDMNTGKPLTVYKQDGSTETPQVEGKDGYFNEIAYLLDCIERGETPSISTPDQSREAVVLALAEKQSAQSGKTVAVS